MQDSDVNAGEFIVFVDESGDHGLATIDPQFPVFVLAFCILRKSDYSRGLLPAITDFKFAHFGHDQVILHERDIRKDIGDFAILRDPQRKAAFLDELTSLIEATSMTVVASAIRKDLLVDRFEVPDNPYQIALDFGLKRVAQVLHQKKATGTISVIIECRGKREDDELELEFGGSAQRQAIGGSNSPWNPASFPNPRMHPGCKSLTSLRDRLRGT